ncbi:hypothetical protein JYB62_10840 [Algoriphagus lutimaris]|uniref:hypothetical protein n=1 Tax=Algoriphagus lutimaris TaxID=613197 RepID=UPI00196B0459|nr:hypothetical protein [Algoriphagus lutimaris]MBN3520494.1 hypothetical protein [Algoriphagus lutimaris]
MELIKLDSAILKLHPKAGKSFNSHSALLDSISEKEVPDLIISEINRYTNDLNELKGSDSNMDRRIKKVIRLVLKLLEKECQLVAKNHYRNLWLALGISAFGIPMGVAFGASLGNMAYLGIGLPIGMAIGIAVGMSKDKEALSQGKQLYWGGE